jgi:riboflavin-specific deaminase-like protein
VHRWRWHAGAVLVGIGTVLADDPALTIRHVRGDQPWRLVLDSRLRIPLQAQLLNDDFTQKTIILAGPLDGMAAKARQVHETGARVISLPLNAAGRVDLRPALRELAEMGIAHVFVEGGQGVFSSFMQQGLADRVAVFVAGKFFGAGLPAVDFSGFGAETPLAFKNGRWRRVGEDMLFEGEVFSGNEAA